MNKTIKPTFVKNLNIIRIGLSLLFPPFLIFFAFPIGMLLTCFFCNSALIPTVVGYMVLLVIVFQFTKRKYKATFFEINSNEIESSLKFIWDEKTQVLLRNVMDIELQIGMLQKYFGLGTIVLHTLVKDKSVSLFDIENPEAVYNLLSKEIETQDRKN